MYPLAPYPVFAITEFVIRVNSNNLGKGGRGSTKCHMNFFCPLNSEFYAFRVKKSSLGEQDLASKGTFFAFHFKVQSL